MSRCSLMSVQLIVVPFVFYKHRKDNFLHEVKSVHDIFSFEYLKRQATDCIIYSFYYFFIKPYI